MWESHKFEKIDFTSLNEAFTKRFDISYWNYWKTDFSECFLAGNKTYDRLKLFRM